MKERDRIRVLIADDSAVVRGIWKKVFSETDDFTVAGLAENGKRAVDLVKESEVDLVLLDIEMPVVDGLTALPLLLQARPGVRVVMASSLTRRGSAAAIQALASGAVDYIAKPSSTSLGTDLRGIADELLGKLRCLKYPTRERPRTGVVSEVRSSALKDAWPPGGVPPRIIVFGCSTGGPNALLSVLRGLDLDVIEAPVVIVQHMPAYFIQLLADRVSREIGKTCRVIENGDVLSRGFIGIAPGDFHVEIAGGVEAASLRLNKNPPENFCRPAVDPLFRSAGEVFGAAVLAVVLTGMGEDGCKGSRAIRARGGRVIVQDEETCVVWGMPGAVAREGLAHAILPVDRIAAAILRICQVGGQAA